ncbi:MAG: hypothetical protein M0Q26_05945 [Chitinophagaceae bacterium]|nr:hypothetical protein [Chitinophagaceae bacterium]MDP1763425.1 hypothetical protein [Sediminibacterium sp.]
MLIVKDEIGYGISAEAVFYTDVKTDGAKVSQPADSSTIASSAIWSYWGDDNQEPVRMAEDIENCGVLSAGIDSKVRMAIGKGLEPYLLLSVNKGEEVLEHVIDAEIQDWLELNKSFQYSYSNIYNFLAYGWGATQIILNKKREKINRIAATDVYTARLEKREASTGIIRNMYLASDWSQINTYDPKTMRRIELLREGYELQELADSSSIFEFGVLHRILKNGRQYYPRAIWQAARAWVKVTRDVPEFKKALHKNSMNIKYVILIAESYWTRIHKGWGNYTPEKRKEIINDKYDEINKFLVGDINAGKTIMAGKYIDPFTKEAIADIEINVLDDKTKEGKFLPDSAAADKQILFSMFFNPAIWGGNLLGDGASGGAGSGSDIREAVAVQLMMMHVERALNLNVFDLVKKYNGWSKRLEIPMEYNVSTVNGNTAFLSKRTIIPRLVFRYKSELLTTLDTGGSTKTNTQ